MPSQALPFVILQGFFFGTTLIASRFSVGQYAPATYIGLRMIIASLAYVLTYALLSGRRWPTDGRLWRHASLLGAVGTAVPMTAIVTSLQFQSSGVTSVLITTSPAIIVLMAHFTLPDETLNQRKILGVILALGGALLLAVRGESGLPDIDQASPLGYGLVLSAMLFSSGATIYARKYMREFDAFDVATVRMIAGAAVVMPLSLLLIGFDMSQVDGRGYLALFYAALAGNFAGMLLAFYNIQRFGATSAALVAYIIPVVATLGGALWLNERISVGMLLGMALIIVGIAIINRRSGPLPTAPGSPPP
jgi:drug/metabolite transporter (DMT)-like permease